MATMAKEMAMVGQTVGQEVMEVAVVDQAVAVAVAAAVVAVAVAVAAAVVAVAVAVVAVAAPVAPTLEVKPHHNPSLMKL